ncbi:hypothetical protein I552_2847 [Mycobacterium xenopi 3993]|nr:hypothetical protein I552_2847 [Mycobacterium xenopi 3993]
MRRLLLIAALCIVGAGHRVPPATLSVSLAISSPTLVAAAVMMSRLPAYGGR